MFNLPISKLHSILAVVNLLVHNNKSQVCYCDQISLQSAAVNCTFSDTIGTNIYFAGDDAFYVYHKKKKKKKIQLFILIATSTAQHDANN